MTSQQPLPSTRRIVTSHREDGQAIVARDSVVNGTQAGHGPWIQLLWSTDELPPDVNSLEDKGLAKTGISNKGTICRIVDFAPRSTGQLHRSITLDYIYVLDGKVVLTLDDGSRTQIDKGALVVQQATMHGWDNETDQWARLLCILVASHPPTVGRDDLPQALPFNV